MDQKVLVLFVDEEPLIFETVKDALEERGFAVRPEHTASGAINALDECAGQLSGLVTDVNLSSDVTGWDVARRARQLRPDLPVVYTSGYSSADWTVLGVRHSTLVAKPYAPAEIVTAILALINKAAAQPGPMPS